MKSSTLRGIPVSPGLVIGKAQVLDLEPEVFSHPSATPIRVEEELERFREALAEAEKRLHQIKQSVEKKAGESDAMIFQAQLSILRDHSAQEEVVKSIREQKLTAEVAVHQLMKSFDEKFQNLADSSRDWVSEVRDPWTVVLQALQQHDTKKILAGKDKIILVTEELTPSLAMYLEKGKVLAIVSERGGKFSHGAILARSYRIPAIAGVEKATSRIVSGMQIVANGDEGAVYLEPSDTELEEHRKKQKERAERYQSLMAHATEPALTQDGCRVSVHANIESLRDFDTFDLSMVDGIGLLRTEFLFRERKELPSEEEQVTIYKQALEKMKGHEVTFRTLDIGGDKPLPMFKTPSERNPALGWRGLRISLEWRDLLIVQLRALLRASAFGPTRILLPMVTRVEEVQTVRKLLDELQADLNRSGVKTADSVSLGIMVEVPAAAYLLRHLKTELQFASIGTNDMTQYLLAVDRDNPWVASLYEPFHPAMLAVIDTAVQQAKDNGKEITVCGEMAGDPLAALLFLSMGIHSLSMGPNSVPAVKALLRQANSKKLANLREEVLGLGTASEVKAVLEHWSSDLWKTFSKTTQGKK